MKNTSLLAQCTLALLFASPLLAQPPKEEEPKTKKGSNPSLRRWHLRNVFNKKVESQEASTTIAPDEDLRDRSTISLPGTEKQKRQAPASAYPSKPSSAVKLSPEIEDLLRQQSSTSTPHPFSAHFPKSPSREKAPLSPLRNPLRLPQYDFEERPTELALTCEDGAYRAVGTITRLLFSPNTKYLIAWYEHEKTITIRGWFITSKEEQDRGEIDDRLFSFFLENPSLENSDAQKKHKTASSGSRRNARAMSRDTSFTRNPVLQETCFFEDESRTAQLCPSMIRVIETQTQSFYEIPLNPEFSADQLQIVPEPENIISLRRQITSGELLPASDLLSTTVENAFNAALTPDEKYLLVLRNDGKLTILKREQCEKRADYCTPQTIYNPKTESAYVTALAAANGLLAAGTADGRILLWRKKMDDADQELATSLQALDLSDVNPLNNNQEFYPALQSSTNPEGEWVVPDFVDGTIYLEENEA